MTHSREPSGVIGAIGQTPLIRLRRASEATGCMVLGKAEFMNPGQSVKDRAALSIIRAAEAEGRLTPGGTIVEGTAGNTGIGLTVVGNALGYRTVIVIPNQAIKVAILADNPGYWPMHCHNTYHGEAGMFTTFDYLN